MDENKSIQGFIDTGSEITGSTAGSVIGFFLGGLPGAAIGGATAPLITKTIRTLADEISHRLIGQREKVRIGATLTYALDKIRTNLTAGKVLRGDDFFGSDPASRSTAEEVFEATLLASQRECEEKKLRYYGNLLANIAFNKTFDRSQANYLIKIAQSLSWQQLCVLSVSVAKGKFGLKSSDYRGQTSFSQPLIFLLHEIQDLYNLGLINFGGDVLLGLTDVKPFAMTAQGAGSHLYNTMELSGVPDPELLPVVTLLQ